MVLILLILLPANEGIVRVVITKTETLGETHMA